MVATQKVVWVALWHNLDTGVWDDEGRNAEEVELIGVRTTRKKAKKLCRDRERPYDTPKDWWEKLEWRDNQAFIERCVERGYYSLHECQL